MTSELQTNPLASTRSNGFVVAMRAKLIEAGQPACYEWVIVSRWGPDGDHLSIGRTLLRALPGEAPIDLTPRRTCLAVRAPDITTGAPAMFLLATSLPDHIGVAGHFVPAEGHVRLYGTSEKLRLRSNAHCLCSRDHRTALQVEAKRAAWLGEFIEPAQAGRS